mmetsp:Transcript_16446/g.50062  ORF Transcript_16446/g.50062 Transcript_16446/m.50062 type:complete len:258 (-) Transcript_16446:3405-4178(-)
MEAMSQPPAALSTSERAAADSRARAATAEDEPPLVYVPPLATAVGEAMFVCWGVALVPPMFAAARTVGGGALRPTPPSVVPVDAPGAPAVSAGPWGISVTVPSAVSPATGVVGACRAAAVGRPNQFSKGAGALAEVAPAPPPPGVTSISLVAVDSELPAIISECTAASGSSVELAAEATDGVTGAEYSAHVVGRHAPPFVPRWPSPTFEARGVVYSTCFATTMPPCAESLASATATPWYDCASSLKPDWDASATIST